MWNAVVLAALMEVGCGYNEFKALSSTGMRFTNQMPFELNSIHTSGLEFPRRFYSSTWGIISRQFCIVDNALR